MASVEKLNWFKRMCWGMFALVVGCTSEADKESLLTPHINQPSLQGNSEYLASPFVAAGDRVYLIGHQDGSFPDLGWHITGEMGGIWNHPIKLMDGFDILLAEGEEVYALNQAHRFINYPFGARQIFRWEAKSIQAERFQFVPDGEEGVVIELTLTNEGDQQKEISLTFTGRVDLRPTWLGERTGMKDAVDTVKVSQSLAVGRDTRNPWHVVFGAGATPETADVTGASAALTYQVMLPAQGKKVLRWVVAGSAESEQAARQTHQRLLEVAPSLLAAKVDRLKVIDSTVELQVNDSLVQHMFRWLKYNNDWLVREVPSIGRGLSAGLPDYPWWFGCDNTYAQQGVLATGGHALTRSTLLLLLKLSRETNGNGRVVHEASTNGAVYNPGNVNETPHFVSLVATYFRWTGDREILNELYPELVKGLAWLEQQDTEGNGFPNGPGMMEIHGLDSEMIDVASYTQQAYEDAAYLASTMGESDRATAFSTKAAQLRQQIQTDWWVPEARSFADFIGTPEEARRLVADALVRADTLQKPWSVAELKQTARRLAQDRSQQKRGHVVYHNWVVNTPLETGLATAEQAAQALATAQRYTNPFGMYVTGVDRTEGPDSVVLKSRKKTFSYVGAVMTLPTGVQAVAAARYGEPDEALSYLHKLANSFSYALPGSMYEVSPDFGMFTQAWNLYAVAVPVVRYFFGIAPDAGQRLIILQPNLPSSWKQATLREVPVGDNKLMFFVARETGKTNYRFAQTQADWKVRMLLPDEGEVWLDDQPLHDLPLENGRVVLELAGAHHTIEVRHR